MKYEGFELEFDTSKEAFEFLSAGYEKPVIKKENVFRPTTSLIKQLNLKKRTGYKAKPWTIEEVRFILEKLPVESDKSISTSRMLSRHTVNANRQMIWKAKTNNSQYKVKGELQTIIDAYHGLLIRP